tara:strand:- start:1449 stop:1652 length:204 start_codon:yes stop_codon:yes gene_type:complete
MNWREINKVLPDLDEDTIKKMLDEERVGEQRQSVLVRLHQRYTMLRAARERMEILGDVESPKVMALT